MRILCGRIGHDVGEPHVHACGQDIDVRAGKTLSALWRQKKRARCQRMMFVHNSVGFGSAHAITAATNRFVLPAGHTRPGIRRDFRVPGISGRVCVR
jgi:hypothetical protein